CQAGIIANRAEMLGETSWRLLRRRRWSTGRTIGCIAPNRQRGGIDADVTKMNMAERQYVLAGQPKKRQPGNSTAVRSEPTHGSRPWVSDSASISYLSARPYATSL